MQNGTRNRMVHQDTWEARRRRRNWRSRLHAFLLALLLLMPLQIMPASGATGTTSSSTTARPSPGAPTTTAATDETEHSGKVTGKYVRKPPFVITVDDSNILDLSDTSITAGMTTYLTLIGQNNSDKLEGEWTFAFRYRFVMEADMNPIKGLVGGVGMGFDASGTGSATAPLKTPKRPSPTPTPLFTTDEDDAPPDPLASLVPEEDTYVPTGEFTTTVPMLMANMRGGDTVHGRLEAPDGSQWVEGGYNLFDSGTTVNLELKFHIVVKPDDQVRVTVEADGKTAYFDGWLTSEQELDVKRKETWKWPIWGVWTDINPYNAMPGVEKDLTALEEDPDKKISYPAGNWLAMKAGKKEDAATYQIVETTAEQVIWEKGEIWAYPGSAMFKPTLRRVFSPDLKTVLSEQSLGDRPVDMTYRTESDRLWVPTLGNLVRVRNGLVPGSWSDAGDHPVPGYGDDTELPDGTWIVFARTTSNGSSTSGSNNGSGGSSGSSGSGGSESDAPQAIAGYSGTGTFTRLFVEDGEIFRTDKGSALCMPIGDDDLMALSGITSETDGSKIDIDDETVHVSDFDKAAGTVSLNGVPYFNAGNPSPVGSWYSDAAAPVAPDIAGGGVKPRREDGTVVEPRKRMQWLTLNDDKTFVWTQVVENGDGELEENGGILEERGKFKTVGGNMLQLTDMTGTYVPFDPDATGFENQQNGLADRLLQFDHDKDAGTLEISGAGTFTKTAE